MGHNSTRPGVGDQTALRACPPAVAKSVYITQSAVVLMAWIFAMKLTLTNLLTPTLHFVPYLYIPIYHDVSNELRTKE